MSAPSPTLFISDLHLDAARPNISRQFLDFLRDTARGSNALYILGDLFEVWIGDDDPDPDKARIMDALRELTRGGTQCFVMHGNRDFLLGRKFCERTGARLLADGTVVNLHGERVLLLHGDTLCTDDHSYQRLRRILRNPISRAVFRVMSLAQRQRLAQRLRAGSQAHLNSLSTQMPDIMDVNEDAVRRTFEHYGVRCMIHGHTHRPAVHTLQVDGHKATRIVLGDWYTQGSVLRWDANGFDLWSLPSAQVVAGGVPE
ncbi:MAG: UDP-2,3-diacylglucosamine diphosphatase [Steroidobacteraceae bacterium]